MKKRAYIIHGWGATSKDNWFQWAKWELENHDFEVVVPDMPETDFPKLEDWLSKMNEVIGKANESTFFIGHSLGTITILKYLESLKGEVQIGGTVLVSGFSQNFGLPTELENFTENKVDFELVKKACKKFVIFQSDTDPLVPLSEAIVLRNELDGDLHLIHNAGHLNEGSESGEFPELIEEILNISK